jgi:hypothetical protein
VEVDREVEASLKCFVERKSSADKLREAEASVTPDQY